MKKLITTMAIFCLSLTTNAQDWSLNGNSGTSPGTDFLGTIDNLAFILKTHSIQRVSVSGSYFVGGRNLSYVSLNQPDSINTPVSLNVYATDMVGYQMPVFISCDISGMTYDYNSGGYNTLGRFIRLNQGNTNSFGGSHFYDFGMQDSSMSHSFYITQHQVPGGGYFPKKMITVSSDDRVGLNLDWSDLPTADLHTKGTVRHEGLPSSDGNILVVDGNGNVYVSNCRTRCGEKGKSTAEEIDELKAEIAELKKQIQGNVALAENTVSKVVLQQNNPNPFNNQTNISFSIPQEIKRANLIIYNLEGKQLKSIGITPSIKGSATIQANDLNAGMYIAMLVCDNGMTSNTIKMVLSR